MKLDEVHIELCSFCNAGCSHCTWGKRTDAMVRMPTETARGLIDECASLGVRTVNFHGIGEPTLHPDLLHVLHHAEARGMDFWLSTNCKKLPLFADSMARLKNLTLVLAVPWSEDDAFIAEAERNAVEYLKLAPDNRRVFVQMVMAEDAERHIWRMMGTFATLVERTPSAIIYLKQPLTWPDMDPVKGFTPPGLKTGGKLIVEAAGRPISIGRGCTMPTRFLKVNANGSVVPCCVGSGEWGLPSYPEATLKAIWESTQMEEVRRKWREADDGIPCGHCIKRSDC